jgi:Zn-dependent protease with chaperone function
MDANEAAARRKRWAVALWLILVFPIVAFLIGSAVPAKYRNDLFAATEQDLGRPLTSDERASVDIEEVCRDPEISGDQVCADIAIAAATRWVAVASLVAGLLVLGVIAFCTRQAGRDRDALLRLFRPGLYATLVGTTLLVTADALLVLASLYLSLGVFLGGVYPWILLLVAVGGLLGIVGMVRALISTTRRAKTNVIGVRRTAADEPGLHGLVQELAADLGADAPENVLVGLDPTFFVTEADVEATDGRWSGRNLFLSIPLMRILDAAELRAVIGHELGHFRGHDSAYSTRFYPIYRGTGEAVGRLAQAGAGNVSRSLALLPALVLLTLFYEGFAAAERAISRDRELAADIAGTEAASARDLGTALLKLSAFGQQWPAALGSVVGRARTATPVPNLGDLFVGLTRKAAVPAALARAGDRDIPHPTDSHPPVAQRLQALGLAATELSEAALMIDPSPAADAILQHREPDERTLTAWVNERVRRTPTAPREAAPAKAT